MHTHCTSGPIEGLKTIGMVVARIRVKQSAKTDVAAAFWHPANGCPDARDSWATETRCVTCELSLVVQHKYATKAKSSRRTNLESRFLS